MAADPGRAGEAWAEPREPPGAGERCRDRCDFCCFATKGTGILYSDLLCKGRRGLDWRARVQRNIEAPSDMVAGGAAVVTGANAGLGYHVALGLARAGLTVVLACRSEEKGAAAAQAMNETLTTEGARGRAEFVARCDIADLDSVRAFCAAVRGRRGGALRVVVNNAGVMATPYRTTKQGWEEQFGSMHLGHALLNLLLLDCLRAGGGRVVIVSSATAHGARFLPAQFERRPPPKRWNRHKAYSDAKQANNIFANALADYIWLLHGKGTHGAPKVTVHALHPGCIATNISRHLSVSTDDPVTQCYQRCTHIPVEEGASHVLHLALSRDLDGAGKDRAAGEEWRWFDLGRPARMAAVTYDSLVRAEFWQLTVKTLKEWLPPDWEGNLNPTLPTIETSSNCPAIPTSHRASGGPKDQEMVS